MNLLILFGGESGEHDISCISASSVLTYINKEKYNIIKVGITKDGKWLKTDADAEQIKSGEWQSLENEPAFISPDAEYRGLYFPKSGECVKIDAVFPVMHGTNCEDGVMQGLFKLAKIPFVGPSVLGSAVGMDKHMAKLAFVSEGIPVTPGILVNALTDDMQNAADKAEKELSYPVFVKPCNEGSSLGTHKAKDRRELIDALNEAAKHDSRILIEKFINAREIECAVLGNLSPMASCLGEITPQSEFYDFDAKYVSGTSVLTIPAPLSEEVTKKIQDYAVKAFCALTCRGLSRVDFFIDKDTGEIYLNEINTLPGFTSISMYPKLWQASGVEYSDLIDRLIELAFEEK